MAFCLEVLGQWPQADSLHWSLSVNQAMAAERKKMELQRTGDTNLQDTLALTARRLAATLKEFDLLAFSISSARIFFQEE